MRRADHPEPHTEVSNRQVHRKPDLSVHSRGYEHPRVQRAERLHELLLERGFADGPHAHRRAGWQRAGLDEHYAAGADAQSIEKSGNFFEAFAIRKRANPASRPRRSV